MKSWRGYPVGNPETDRARLEAWLRDDLQVAGLRGSVSLSPSASGQQADSWGLGDWVGAFLGQRRTTATSRYHTAIPGAGRHVDLIISTTSQGAIASLLYVLETTREFRDEIRFIKERFVGSGRFDGPRAKELNRNKPLVRQLRATLSAEHAPLRRSWFGLRTRAGGARATSMILDPAYIMAGQTADGWRLIAGTQVFAPRNLSWLTLNYIPIYQGEWRLGIPQVLEGARLLESVA